LLIVLPLHNNNTNLTTKNEQNKDDKKLFIHFYQKKDTLYLYILYITLLLDKN